MTHPPFQHAESLRIGSVDFVSPDEIKVSLDIEAPESVALNAGGPRPFPRVNGYVLIPVDDGFLVGQIEWLTIERSAFPKRRGLHDFGLIDLPYPLRKMSLNPLGTLRKAKHNPGRDEEYSFRRGAEALPSIGTGVLLPTENQLRSIVESGDRRRVKIGTSPLAGNAEVRIDPDRLFGRHLAVLGNTGSGKSCSVAGLIRWSLEQAMPENGTAPNARFIVLDPNGEYCRAFNGGENPAMNARVYRVAPSEDSDERPLQVPLWFWNSAEWCSFTQASAKAQRPLLKRALREVKSGRATAAEPTNKEVLLSLRRYVAFTVTSIQKDVRAGAIKTEETKFGYRLKAIYDDIEQRKGLVTGVDFDKVQKHISAALTATFKSFNDKSGKTVEFYRAFTEAQIEAIVTSLIEVLDGLGGVVPLDGPDEDVPLPFDGASLADHLEILAEQANASQYLEFLIARIRTFLADTRMKAVACNGAELTLEEWLREYVGADATETGCISVLDLSLVPSEIVHIIAAVVARVAFESLQRYRKLNGFSLPTVLVMEEAHSFVKRYKDDVDNHDAATVCCQVFERIAREGRKFGLGLVLSSQRPAELSPTVLSQCNTFLLHRISNDRDQELVHRLVPDNLRGLLRELPSLPSQNAILLGWATELPVLVKMNDLPTKHQPQSDDPEFWNVWTRKTIDGKPLERDVNWKVVADDWQGNSAADKHDDP